VEDGGVGAATPLRALDPAAPWLAPLRAFLPLLNAADLHAALNGAARAGNVSNARGLPIEFVAAGDASGAPYELHIHATGRVPTRISTHDVFNALMWLALPRTKAALNAVHAEVIAREGVSARRGPARDAATLLDESGVLLACDDAAVWEALAAHDWQRLFFDWRARWGVDIVPIVLGHALLEKLVDPYQSITACVLGVGGVVGGEIARADADAARQIATGTLMPRALLHLPVFGIPGWCAANEDPKFYDDVSVFRVKRSS
jgi:hypothetical protein